MKKIILSLLMIVCCLFSFTACDNLGENYWKDTNKVATEIFESENFLYAYNVTFSDKITEISAKTYGKEFKELTEVFSPLFTSAISYAYFHYEDFLISPKNNNDAFKSEIKIVNNNLSALKNQLTNFKNKKEEYETWTTQSSENFVTSDTERVRLQLFKREYICLIVSAFNLSSSVFDARRAGYYDFSDYSNDKLILVDALADCDLAVSLSNLEILDTAIKIVKEYNAKESASDYKDYWQASKDFYNNVVLKLKNKELTAKETVKEELLKWNNVYDLFMSENQRFIAVLEKIDLQLLTNFDNDAEKYAEQTNNKNDIHYVEYYLGFYKNIEILQDYSLNLFN